MAMNHQSWGHVTPELMGTKFTWSIDNFTGRYTAMGEKFSSTVFFTGKDYKDEWCVEMYPKGQCDSDKDYVCVALRLLRTEKADIRVNIKYTLVKPDADEAVVPLSFPIYHQVFVKNMSTRVTRIMDCSEILNYLKNDTLKIVCEMTSAEARAVSSLSKMTEESGSFPPRMSDDIWNMFQDQKYSDTVIIAEGEKFHVHKLLLKIRSPVFAAMFEHNLMETQTNEIKIEGIKPEVVRKMLQFIYTDRLDNFEDTVRDLLMAADRYSLQRLTALCAQVLCEKVGIENAVSTLILAERYNSKCVKKYVSKFINGNLPDLIETTEYKDMEESHPALVSYLVREMASSMSKN